MTQHTTAEAPSPSGPPRRRLHPAEMTHRLARGPLGRPLVRTVRRVLRQWAPPASGSDYTPVVHRGQPIPPLALRNHMCGEAFLSNDFYLQSAVVEATRLPAQLGFTPGSRVIDVGCGLGRLATGMIEELGEDVDYLGIEPNRPFYEWCRDNIEASHPGYRFVHVDVVSELYNPEGTVDGDALRLPVESDSVDIVYVWGVFTNIIPEHVETYVAEFRRVVRDGEESSSPPTSRTTALRSRSTPRATCPSTMSCHSTWCASTGRGSSRSSSRTTSRWSTSAITGRCSPSRVRSR